MCPGTLAIVGAAGAAASAGGALFNGIAASQAASYQATVSRNNALIADQNAQRAIAAGQQQAQTQSLKNAETIGGIKTAQAANNIDVNSGSALDVQASQRAKGQLDAETVLQKAQTEAYGYRVNAVSNEAQAGLEEATAEDAPIGAGLSAAGSLAGNSKFTSVFSDSNSGGGTGTFSGNFGSSPTWIGGT